MKISRIITFVFAVGAIFIFTGCGAKGQKFTEFAKPQEDKGLVYVYRPSSFVGGGVYYDVHVTNSSTPDFVAGELTNGAYLEIDVPKGENEIWGKTEAKSSVTLDIEAGDVQCVKGGVGLGFIVGRPHLKIVDMQTCQKEIVETKKP